MTNSTKLTPETHSARAAALKAAEEAGQASAQVRCAGIVSSAEAMELAASLESNPQDWGTIEGAEYLPRSEAAVAARDAEIAEVRLIAQGLEESEAAL